MSIPWEGTALCPTWVSSRSPARQCTAPWHLTISNTWLRANQGSLLYSQSRLPPFRLPSLGTHGTTHYNKVEPAWELLTPRTALVHACMWSHFSHVQFFATLQTVAHWAPLSMGFSRQEHWEWAAMLSSRESSQPRDRTWVSLHLLHWQTGSLPLVPPEKPKSCPYFTRTLQKQGCLWGLLHPRISAYIKLKKSSLN